MKDKELMLAVTKHASVETITNILAKNPAAAKSVNKFTKRLALHWACVYHSPLEVVSALVEKYPQAIALLDKESLTPLHHICSTPELEDTYLVQVATLFIEQCPKAAQVVNETGCTPLHLACEFKLPIPIVRLLVETYPEAVILPTKNGLTALDLACHKEAKDWATPEDRTAILELLRETQVQVLEQQKLRQEQERQEREEQERLDKEAAEKKRLQDEARQKREDDIRDATEAVEKRQREAQEKARKKKLEEEAQKAKEKAAAEKKRQEEEQKEREQQEKEQKIRDLAAEQKRLAEEEAAAEEEEKKCDEQNLTQPASEKVGLKPRVEPPPGLVFQERRRLKAAEKEHEAARLAMEADSLVEQSPKVPLESNDGKIKNEDHKAESSSQAREILLNILHPTASVSKSSEENVEHKDNPTDGALQKEHIAHKALFDKDRQFSTGTVPVTPETTWQRSTSQSKQPSAPPGFHGNTNQLDIISPLLSYHPEIWQDKTLRNVVEADNCALFPEVNLQSLAAGLGYDRLFDFDEGSSSKANDPTFQKLQGELLSHSEESARLRKAQQQQWREELKNNAERTPLHLACAHKEPCMKTIRLLVDKWPEFLEKSDEQGRLALHVACEHGCPLELIELLVGKFPGAVKTADKAGNTPLHICSENQSPFDVVQFLAENMQFLSETPSSNSSSSSSSSSSGCG